MAKQSQRILLVASDPLTSAALANNLRMRGVEIITCEEVEAAEALLSHSSFHALITDLLFTKQGGLEGLKLIHHVATHFPDVIVVGVVDRLDDEMRGLVLRAGATVVFEKPITLSDLKPVVTDGLPEPTDTDLKKGSVHHLSRLEDFLEQHSIDALLQPIVSLRSNDAHFHTVGVESLARGPKNLPLWNPEVLFAYAAKKEQLFETDMFCIRAALKEAKLLHNAGRLFINVRPRSLIHPQFVRQITLLCEQADLQPQTIVLELTEQQTILNQKAFSFALEQLRERGFAVALDDFGVGFANLQLVQDLRPDYIKVSGIFCRNLENDDAKQTIVQATTQMAQRLQIPTILENVETAQELEKARVLGIDCAQGYYFCRPQSGQTLIASKWFEKHPVMPNTQRLLQP